jgi:hypothetical protein
MSLALEPLGARLDTPSRSSELASYEQAFQYAWERPFQWLHDLMETFTGIGVVVGAPALIWFTFVGLIYGFCALAAVVLPKPAPPLVPDWYESTYYEIDNAETWVLGSLGAAELDAAS